MKRSKRYLSVLSAAFFSVIAINPKCYSQPLAKEHEIFRDSSKAYAEIQGWGGSSGRTPFWMQTNQLGTVPAVSPAGRARIVFEHYRPFDGAGKRNALRAGVGMDAVVNVSRNAELLLPQ